jgi:hypothetical protein
VLRFGGGCIRFTWSLGCGVGVDFCLGLGYGTGFGFIISEMFLIVDLICNRR